MPASKKVAETDAIFTQLAQVHAPAAADPSVLRLSVDAKATVKVGPFSRRGQSRAPVRAGRFCKDYNENSPRISQEACPASATST